MRPITTLIVDDEPLARAGLLKLLEAESDVSVAGQAADGRAALTLIGSLKPDLVLLDVQLPDMSGFDLLRLIPAERRPAVIFTTAHAGFAVQAFELHAVDYLLKPCAEARFRQAVDRARRMLVEPDAAALLAMVDSLLQHRALRQLARPAGSERIVLKSGTDLHVCRAVQVKWVEGQGDYLRVHGVAGNTLVRETMGRFLGRMPAGRFVRVHKSTIVNVDFVRRLESIHSGDCRLELTDGTILRVSRHYREQLCAALESGAPGRLRRERVVAPANALSHVA